MTTTNEDERVVLLGTVQERQAVNDSSPYACKAGGLPAWYKSDEPPQEAKTLACTKCQRALFLVAQVYAPVDTDRTLYIFGCNSVDCTETPGSWRALRDQSETVDTAAAVSGDDEQQSQVNSSAPKSAWDAGSDGDSSDWGDSDDDKSDPFAVAGGGDDLIDLEQLLLQRDDAMKLPASKPTAPQQKKATADAKGDAVSASSAAGKSTSGVFPAMPIDVIDEPYEDYMSEYDYSHENALLDEYIKQEEEEKSTDVGDLRKVISSAKKNGGNGTTGSSSSGESYEKTPAQQRHFMRFQKRINRCPLQCLRYDYGGEPLWPVPKPQNVKIPKFKPFRK
uniref:Programmed cell death protein 2 C-terminal domain-containing protein n=1 Tax=Globisporangium ultimum (strain ATCC 200006 / CBS 805.95 / DAOM BR144) TaxID=431595 RepID=K3X913_GLOUD